MLTDNHQSTRQFCLDFPRAHGQPLGRGVLRTTPEDFHVTEELGFDLAGEGEHLFLRIRKTGANTGWVCDQLAAYFKLRHFDVSYAGKKDRHAVTEQWFSCWLPQDAPDLSNLVIEGVEVLEQVRHLRKLRRGDHCANRFDLTVRLTDPIPEALLAQRIEQIARLGFPNYFGPQRFGIGGSNLDRAEELMQEVFKNLPDPTLRADNARQDSRGRKRGRGSSGRGNRNFSGKLSSKLSRQERDMTLSAARSYLFNLSLAELVDTESWFEGDGWLVGEAPHRDIPAPAAPAGFENWGNAIASLGIKAMQRPNGVVPEKLNWRLEEEKLMLSFSLPAGAFATSLVAELIEYEEAH